MEKLGPCPFCGNKMQITTSKCITADGPKTGYHGYCAECGMHTQTRSSEEQAIADVNRRAALENKLTEDQQEADELIRSLISGKDVNPCEWCHTPDKGGETCKGCYLYEDSDRFPSKFTAFSAAPENKPLTLKELPCFEPIYVVPLGSSVGEWSAHWCIYQIDNATAKSDTHKGRMWFLYDTDYGKTWLAYARKPEGSETK